MTARERGSKLINLILRAHLPRKLFAIFVALLLVVPTGSPVSMVKPAKAGLGSCFDAITDGYGAVETAVSLFDNPSFDECTSELVSSAGSDLFMDAAIVLMTALGAAGKFTDIASCQTALADIIAAPIIDALRLLLAPGSALGGFLTAILGEDDVSLIMSTATDEIQGAIYDFLVEVLGPLMHDVDCGCQIVGGAFELAAAAIKTGKDAASCLSSLDHVAGAIADDFDCLINGCGPQSFDSYCGLSVDDDSAQLIRCPSGQQCGDVTFTEGGKSATDYNGGCVACPAVPNGMAYGASAPHETDPATGTALFVSSGCGCAPTFTANRGNYFELQSCSCAAPMSLNAQTNTCQCPMGTALFARAGSDRQFVPGPDTDYGCLTCGDRMVPNGDRSACIACADNEYVKKAGGDVVCAGCPAGQGLDPDGRICIDLSCPANQVRPSHQATTYTTDISYTGHDTQCKCPHDGMYISQKPGSENVCMDLPTCKLGTHFSFPQEDCENICPPGTTYLHGPGEFGDKCIPITAGQGCDPSKSIVEFNVCTACPDGSKPSSDKMNCDPICDNGSSFDGLGCQPCASGTYGTSNASYTGDVDQYGNKQHTETFVCLQCPSGTTSVTGSNGLSSCVQPPNCNPPKSAGNIAKIGDGSPSKKFPSGWNGGSVYNDDLQCVECPVGTAATGPQTCSPVAIGSCSELGPGFMRAGGDPSSVTASNSPSRASSTLGGLSYGNHFELAQTPEQVAIQASLQASMNQCVCKPGYEMDRATRDCVPTVVATCDGPGRVVDLNNPSQCACGAGYYGAPDGRTCVAVPCPAGFTYDDQKRCVVLEVCSSREHEMVDPKDPASCVCEAGYRYTSHRCEKVSGSASLSKGKQGDSKKDDGNKDGGTSVSFPGRISQTGGAIALPVINNLVGRSIAFRTRSPNNGSAISDPARSGNNGSSSTLPGRGDDKAEKAGPRRTAPGSPGSDYTTHTMPAHGDSLPPKPTKGVDDKLTDQNSVRPAKTKGKNGTTETMPARGDGGYTTEKMPARGDGGGTPPRQTPQLNSSTPSLRATPQLGTSKPTLSAPSRTVPSLAPGAKLNLPGNPPATAVPPHIH